MDIPLIGGAYEYRSKNINAQECMNLFVFIDQEGGNPASLVKTPGSKLFCDLGNFAEVRGLWKFGSYLFAVCGNTLYRINSNGNKTTIGTIGTSNGPVSMADNGTQLMIVDGSNTGYLCTSGALAAISDEDFPGANLVVFADGYFIIDQPQTDYFWISALYDGDSWDALDVGSSETLPDLIKSLIVDHRELVVFNEEVTEPFDNTGDADFPYSRIDNALMEMGCGSAFSPAKNDNTIFWHNDREQIVRAEGYIPKIISTRQIEYQISKYSKTDDAKGFTMVIEGQSFYCLTFPTQKATWLYNAATGLMANWTSYPDFKRHRANCYAKFGRKHIIGDYENGRLYELDIDTNTDNDEYIKRVRSTALIRGQNGKAIVYPRLELWFEGGVGLATGQGSDPKVSLEWSDDGGHTWSNQHWGDLGKIGVRTNRFVWTQLGRSPERIFRFTITDPVDISLISCIAPDAYLED